MLPAEHPILLAPQLTERSGSGSQGRDPDRGWAFPPGGQDLRGSAPHPRQKAPKDRAPLFAPCPTFLLPAASPSLAGAADAARRNVFPEGKKSRAAREKLLRGGGRGRAASSGTGGTRLRPLTDKPLRPAERPRPADATRDPPRSRGPPTPARDPPKGRGPSRHRPETLREAERRGARAARVSGGR